MGLYDISMVCRAVPRFNFRTLDNLLTKSAFKPKLSRYNSSKFNDFRRTCNILSILSWDSLTWLALNFVNHVLYSRALIIGIRSLKDIFLSIISLIILQNSQENKNWQTLLFWLINNN